MSDEIRSLGNKYHREIVGSLNLTESVGIVLIDLYDVLVAYNVTCPALQHAIKKLICAGLRGHKDYTQDLLEAINSVHRAVEIHKAWSCENTKDKKTEDF